MSKDNIISEEEIDEFLSYLLKLKGYKFFVTILSSKLDRGHKIVTNLDGEDVADLEIKIFINSLHRIAMEYKDNPFHGWLCVQNYIELAKKHAREMLEENGYFEE
jgi:hypothetical protein